MKPSLWFCLATAAVALPASADCTWEWLCSGDGSCKQMPVCETVYDVPPPRPETAAPTPPPLAMRPHKIPSHMAGLDCETVMRQSASGRWTWTEACFCSDQMKAADPTKPFANIVRCQPPWKEPEKKAEPAPQGRAPA